MSYVKIGILVMSLHAFAACNNTSVEEDMKAYCDCISQGESNCQEIIEGIVDKYQFDPEASKVIEERIKECAH